MIDQVEYSLLKQALSPSSRNVGLVRDQLGHERYGLQL